MCMRCVMTRVALRHLSFGTPDCSYQTQSGKAEEGPNCTFENWVPLSPNNRFLIKEGAFLTITDPLEPLKAHFIERFGEDDGELTDPPAEERQGDPDATGGDVG